MLGYTFCATLPMGPAASMFVEAVSGQNVSLTRAAALLPVPSARLLKYFTVPAVCSASRVSLQKFRRSALKPDAIGASTRRDTVVVAAFATASPTRNELTTPCL